MLRVAITRALPAALVVAAAIAPSALGARRADSPSLANPSARVLACDMTGTDRSAVFYGRMDAIPGTVRMSMRFTLLERLGQSASWERVDVPALRQARRSAAGVKTFAYKQAVDNLRVGGAYKARVQYRWVTAAGTVLAQLNRETPACRGALPNLQVARVDVLPGPTGDTRVYRVTVSNVGKGDADAVDVRLSVDRAILDTVTVDQLDAGDSHSVSFTGPACARSIRVAVDPANDVGERTEDDNSQAFACQG